MAYNNRFDSRRQDQYFESARKRMHGDDDTEKDNELPMKNDKKIKTSNNFVMCGWFAFLILCVVAGVGYYLWFYMGNDPDLDNRLIMKKLISKYPKQNNNLWSNVRKMLTETGGAHNLVLFYPSSRDHVLAECLAKDIINVINKRQKWKNEINLNLSKDGEEVGNMNLYIELMKQMKHLFIPKLHDFPAPKARVLQTLCDETILDNLKPSYCIFTLQDIGRHNGKVSDKLYERASDILRNSWKALLENELNPLIIRVVRNVVEVSPEDFTEC